MRKLSIVLLACLLLMLSACNDEKPKTMVDFYEGELSNVSKIVLRDGSTGFTKTVTDKSMIDSFINEVEEVKFIRDENQEERYGFRYAIKLFEENKLTFSVTLNKINDTYYKTNPDIFPFVDVLYQSIDDNEE
jgi:hypothetical protein